MCNSRFRSSRPKIKKSSLYENKMVLTIQRLLELKFGIVFDWNGKISSRCELFYLLIQDRFKLQKDILVITVCENYKIFENFCFSATLLKVFLQNKGGMKITSNEKPLIFSFQLSNHLVKWLQSYNSDFFGLFQICWLQSLWSFNERSYQTWKKDFVLFISRCPRNPVWGWLCE